MSLIPKETLKTRAFLSFTTTQFLGAFNDNTFKQMMLLLGAGAAAAAADQQGKVLMVFTIPFLLFSGYAGQLSEMYPKTTIMRLSKIGELVIMMAGMLAFWLQSMPLLMVVLFFMGSQSAFFGPAKYGIIPEIVAEEGMVRANGVIQMTTIVAIVVGIALGGALQQHLGDRLHLASLFCILVAVAGIGSVYLIPSSRANKPKMKFDYNPIGRLSKTFKIISKDKALVMALVAYTYFYFSGALVTLTINKYGLHLLNLGPQNTSFLLVSLSVGIVVGSLAASPLQKGLSGKWTIFAGAVGVSIAEALLFFHQQPLGVIHGLLFLAGASSGLYFVPIAAFMQSRPPLGQKGEILAAVNFSNFAGILVSSLVWDLLINRLQVPVNAVWPILAAGLAVLLVIMFPQLKKLDLTQPHDWGEHKGAS